MQALEEQNHLYLAEIKKLSSTQVEAIGGEATDKSNAEKLLEYNYKKLDASF